MKRLSIAGMLACAALSLLGPAAARAQAPVTVKLGIAYPNVDTLPLYVGREQGYFADERLVVEATALASGDKIAFALLGGSIDIASYTPDWFIRAVEKGGSDLKIVMGASNDLIFSMVVPTSVDSYADLKGKRVGVSTVKAADAYLVKKMFAAHGIGEAEFVPIQAGSSPERSAALRAGSLAATLITPPIDQRVIDEGGFKRLDISTNVVKHYAWHSQTVRGDWAKANKPVLVGYIRAWIKGTRWLHDPANKEAVVKIMVRELKTEDRYARTSYEMFFGPTASVAKDAAVDFAGYEALLKDMIAQGQMSGPPAPQKYIDTAYWEAAHGSMK